MPKGSETVYIALIVFVVFVVLVVNGVQHVNWFTFCASRFLFKTDLIRERERESEREKEKVIKSKLAIAFVNRLLLCYLKNLLAASKVRVRGWYGAAWDELCVNWGRLHPAAVLGAFGGGGEALARATLHSLERRQLQLPPRRAGLRASAASPTWGAANEVRGLFGGAQLHT